METEFQLELLTDGLHKYEFDRCNLDKVYMYIKKHSTVDNILNKYKCLYFWKISRYKTMDLELNSKFIYIPITTSSINIGIIDTSVSPANVYFLTDKYSNDTHIFSNKIYIFNYTNTPVYGIIIEV